MPVMLWWELPRYTYRPQYLQLALLLQERQPSQEDRALALDQVLRLGREVRAREPFPG